MVLSIIRGALPPAPVQVTLRPTVNLVSPMAHLDTAVVLTSVARLVAEATSLEDVVSRLARVLADVIPYERMHVLRLDRADSVVLYTALPSGELEVIGHRLADRDLAAGPVLDGDTHSVMICPLRQATRVPGALWFTSSRPAAFADEHYAL